METLVEPTDTEAEVTPEVSPARVAPAITQDDYCDGCGATAKVVPAHVATHEKFGSIMYCAHHARKHAEGLTTKGFVIEPPVVNY